MHILVIVLLVIAAVLFAIDAYFTPTHRFLSAALFVWVLSVLIPLIAS